tara:strand:+ start:310 stop:615 length:306 start_codon:yes stop_codon:yes gene_type:complete
MDNKKIFLFAFLSLFLVSCDGIGGVTLTDKKGNKYTFRNASVTCEQMGNYIYCEGSAVKKNIAGQRYVVDFERKLCKYLDLNKTNTNMYLICSAAEQQGKL